MTRNGIERNLEITPYIVKRDNYIFCFSSFNYREKFNEEIERFIEFFHCKLYRNLGLRLAGDFDIISLIALYEKIEKRGFLIKYKGVNVYCKNNLILNGEVMITKN